MSDETHYTVLGIPETATQGEIERRYRNFIEAYQVLSDSTQRSSYDQMVARQRQQNVPAPAVPLKAAPIPGLSIDNFDKQIPLFTDEEELSGVNPWVAVLIAIFFVGLGYTAFFIVTEVPNRLGKKSGKTFFEVKSKASLKVRIGTPSSVIYRDAHVSTVATRRLH